MNFLSIKFSCGPFGMFFFPLNWTPLGLLSTFSALSVSIPFQCEMRSLMTLWKPKLHRCTIWSVCVNSCLFVVQLDPLSLPVPSACCSALHFFLCWLVLLLNYRFQTVGVCQYGHVPALLLSSPCYQRFRETTSVSTQQVVFIQTQVSGWTRVFFYLHLCKINMWPPWWGMFCFISWCTWSD